MRALAASVLAIALLSGCASSGNPGASVSSNSSSVRTSLSPSLQASPAASSTTSAVDFSCTLPVVTQGQPQYGWSGGFVTFPGATYRPDPAGVLNNIGDGELETQAKPALLGYAVGSPFYDLARNRWLPVTPAQTSADGSSYAFASPLFGGDQETISIVTVTTGESQAIELTLRGHFWQVADYDGRYVYLVETQVDQYPAGVWRLDRATGDMQQLLATDAGHVLLVRNGVAWVGLINPTDPSPPIPPKGEAFDTIASINLSTGAQTTWIYTPRISETLVGVDESNRPVVSSAPPPDFDATHGTVALVPAPGAGWIGTGAGLTLFSMQPDAGRIWFGAETGIYLWTQASGFNKVFAFTGDAALGQAIMPAGHCV
jgi:hypothetical protein